jgi:hypothetical protein
MDTKKRKPDLVTCPLQYIQWVDAVADVEWQEDVKAEVHLCHSIGWVIDETDEALCIASTVSMDNSNARMHLPKQWIKVRKDVALETEQRQVQRKTPAKVGKRSNTSQVQSGGRRCSLS